MMDPKRIARGPLLGLLLWTSACARAEARPGEEPWSQAELERVTAEIQAEVADMRGRPFQRPVAVELSDKAGFLAHAKERMEAMTPEGKLEHDQDVARHLGMIPPDMDLLAKTMELLADQVGGFYSPTSETFYLMESFTGDAARVILAHELCHALDDQHFDLDDGFERSMGSTDASTAYAAVVEGSGTLLMTRWTLRHIAELDTDDLMKAGSSGAEALGSSPPYIWKPLLTVYQQGQAFLNAGYQVERKGAQASGQRADPSASVDRAFARPPRSTEQVLHPEKYWVAEEADEPRVVRHALGELPDGWEELERDVLGELLLAILTLPYGERAAPDLTDPAAALGLRFTSDAASGWGGDEVLLLGRGEARIVDLATCWDTPQDALEFRRAVEALEADLAPALKALAGGDARAAGLRVTAGEPADRVRVVTWSGVEREELERVLAGIAIEEAPR